jgi:tRNA-2-methylthio-N6-dimethylallyladenosine synthase
LPVQSGDDEILKKMNRGYTVKEYKNLVKRIRKTFKKYRKGLEKEIAISTDVIVGFPGETEKQFQNTVKLFKEIKFDMAYIAQYSPRPGTVAEKMKDDVPKKEKERRWKVLTEILKETALEKNKKFIGKEIEVLPEEYKNGFLIGKCCHYKTVKFKGESNLIGNFVKVKIANALSWGLTGC